MKTELTEGVARYLRGEHLEFHNFSKGNYYEPELIFHMFSRMKNIIVKQDTGFSLKLCQYGAFDLLVSHVYELRLKDKSLI